MLNNTKGRSSLDESFPIFRLDFNAEPVADARIGKDTAACETPPIAWAGSWTQPTGTEGNVSIK